MPLPWANVATGVYTNSAGVFSGTTGTTTLNGQYVAIADSCGSISKAADASGNLAMGSSSGTDCTTPGSAAPATPTPRARSSTWSTAPRRRRAAGCPSNSWLNAKLTANVNLNQTCNAYWNGSTINFFRSGGGCANTGELPGVSLHEYGHGMDSNDGNGGSPDNGTGETYGDVTAVLATHNSCVGNGFLGSNCGGYGNACTACTRRARHRLGQAHPQHRRRRWTTSPAPPARRRAPTTRTTSVPAARTPSPAATPPTSARGTASRYVASEAVWDLANRDLPSPGSRRGLGDPRPALVPVALDGDRRLHLRHLRRHPHDGHLDLERLLHRQHVPRLPRRRRRQRQPRRRHPARRRHRGGDEPPRHRLHHRRRLERHLRGRRPARRAGAVDRRRQQLGCRSPGAARRASTTSTATRPAATPASPRSPTTCRPARYNDTNVANGFTYYYQVTGAALGQRGGGFERPRPAPR